jgi:hypothetical protein
VECPNKNSLVKNNAQPTLSLFRRTSPGGIGHIGVLSPAKEPLHIPTPVSKARYIGDPSTLHPPSTTGAAPPQKKKFP